MVDVDIENALALDAPSRFTKTLAILVGVTAIVAALLALAESHAGRQEERSLLLSARLAAEATGRIPASSLLTSFTARSQQEAIARQARGTARQIAIGAGPLAADEAQTAVAEADIAAGERLYEAAERMGAVPDASSGLDPFTLDVLGSGVAEAAALIERQGAEVDRAEGYSRQGNRAVLGLSVLAVAAVLFGFAGTVRDSKPGVAALSTATVFLVAAAGIGVSAFLV